MAWPQPDPNGNLPPPFVPVVSQRGYTSHVETMYRHYRNNHPTQPAHNGLPTMTIFDFRMQRVTISLSLLPLLNHTTMSTARIEWEIDLALWNYFYVEPFPFARNNPDLPTPSLPFGQPSTSSTIIPSVPPAQPSQSLPLQPPSGPSALLSSTVLVHRPRTNPAPSLSTNRPSAATNGPSTVISSQQPSTSTGARRKAQLIAAFQAQGTGAVPRGYRPPLGWDETRGFPRGTVCCTIQNAFTAVAGLHNSHYKALCLLLRPYIIPRYWVVKFESAQYTIVWADPARHRATMTIDHRAALDYVLNFLSTWGDSTLYPMEAKMIHKLWKDHWRANAPPVRYYLPNGHR